MKRIIDSKRYDTDKADQIATYDHGYTNDFTWYSEELYRTAKGAWFLAGEGNAASPWSECSPDGGRGPGRGIRPLSEDAAREWLEEHGETAEIERYFEVEDA